MSTEAEFDTAALVGRFTLKALVEACLVLEEGVAAMKDIDLGMMAGAGIIPPPFARADQIGLDAVLAALERATGEWGERFEPPAILRRLVAQGRLGVKTGQGFFPYARPDSGWADGPVKLETRGATAIAWLDRPPANAIAPELVRTLRRLWDQITSVGSVRALVIASANPMLFCAGADIKGFASMDAVAGKELLNEMHALLRSMETSQVVTLAAVNGLALGGGCELAMACDIRIAAESAMFGQPEINLGIIPGFGGTQRLPRLVGEARARELNLTGDPIGAEEAYAVGLANRVVPDEELFDTALAWARKLAEQAPLAVEQIKQVSAAGDIEVGIEREKQGFARVFGSEDAREGIDAFVEKRSPRFRPMNAREDFGPAAERLAELIERAGSVVALTGAGISVPSGIPDFRSPGTGLWAKVDPMEVAHIDAFRRDPVSFWSFYGQRFHALDGKQPNPAHAALATLERAGRLDAVITQNIDRLHARAGTENLIEVHGSIAESVCLVCGLRYRLRDVRRRLEGDPDGVPRCECGGPLKPGVVLFGEYLPVEAMARAEALAARADLMLCIGSSLEVYPVAALPDTTLAAGGQIAILTQGSTPFDHRAAVRMGGDVVDELEAVLAALGLAITEPAPPPEP